jgi:hypothetical protein
VWFNSGSLAQTPLPFFFALQQCTEAHAKKLIEAVSFVAGHNIAAGGNPRVCLIESFVFFDIT